MSYIHYRVEKHVARIVLDHAPANALSLPMVDDLLAHLAEARADDNVRAVVLESAIPRRFSAGLDINILSGGHGESIHALLRKHYVELSEAQYHLGKPSIAAVNGAARAGGMTLAISNDVLIAGKSATFGYPEIDVGLIPAIHFGHLPRLVGKYRAFELLFTGRAFSAEEAYDIGLVSRVVDDDKVVEAALKLAQTFAEKPPGIMKLARNAFMRATDTRSEIGYAVESFCSAINTDEARAGLSAFLARKASRPI
ncbi:MAG: enoyl-CoA hydratase/isomerase family protein [Rhizobiales bacterium]|nr:enoyl-CoA hydratase/isomerase family protein [Hyphomicrobiales bacterium]